MLPPQIAGHSGAERHYYRPQSLRQQAPSARLAAGARGFQPSDTRRKAMADKHNDESQDQNVNADAPSELSRREFVAMSIGAGLAAGARTASGADMPVTEKDVEIKTPDGTCDAAFIYPNSGSHAAVIVWPDAFGLRPSMRDIGKRRAAEGYAVLVPNPFYRVKKGLAVEDPSTFSFGNQADMAKIQPLMASINAAA